MIDASMPYLTPFLLAYFGDRSNSTNQVFDLNLAFQNYIIENNNVAEKKELAKRLIEENDEAEALQQTYLLDQTVSRKLNLYKSNIVIEKRKITYDFDMYDPISILEFIRKGSLVEDIIENLCVAQNLHSNNLFGVSVAVEDQIIPALITIKVLKSIAPSSKIVLGGNVITRIYKELISANLLTDVDIIVGYEGEDTWRCISNSDFQDIETCCQSNAVNLKNTASSSVTIEPYSSSVRFPPRLNYPFHTLNNYHAIYSVLPIITSKRCYWSKCDFCAIYAGWGNKHQRRPISDVLSEIEYYFEKGIKYFRIVDEDLHPNTFIELVNELNHSHIEARFEAYSRFERKLLSDDFYERAYRAGFRQLFFGLESSCKKETDKWNKTKSAYNLSVVDETLQASSKAGILNYVFVLIGIPESNISAENATIDYVINNQYIHCATIGSFVVDKLSPIHTRKDIQDKYNISIINDERITTETAYQQNLAETQPSAKDRAKTYVDRLFELRPDLEISAGLSEENRMILSDQFNNRLFLNNAEKLIASQDPDIMQVVHNTKRRIVKEKIEK